MGLALVAEEKPVAAVRADGAAFFEERAEGRDSRSRTNHDDGTVAIGGKAKAVRRLHEDRQGSPIDFHAFGEKRRANALAPAVVALVAHDGDGQVDFARMRFGAGGNGVKSRLKSAQQRDELSRGECDRREVRQEINNLAAVEKFIKVSSARRREQRFQFRVIGTLGQDPQEIG